MAGETVTLVLDWSEAVTITGGGTPKLTLNTTGTNDSYTGSANVVASKTALSDDDMTFQFDVANTHVSSDLNYLLKF